MFKIWLSMPRVAMIYKILRYHTIRQGKSSHRTSWAHFHNFTTHDIHPTKVTIWSIRPSIRSNGSKWLPPYKLYCRAIFDLQTCRNYQEEESTQSKFIRYIIFPSYNDFLFNVPLMMILSRNTSNSIPMNKYIDVIFYRLNVWTPLDRMN